MVVPRRSGVVLAALVLAAWRGAEIAGEGFGVMKGPIIRKHVVRDAIITPPGGDAPARARQPEPRLGPGRRALLRKPTLTRAVTVAALVRIARSMNGLQLLPVWAFVPMASGGRTGVDEACSRSAADEAMERYADGDVAAFSTVYDELAPRLFRFAARQLQSRTAAEDVVQQALLQIHCAREQFRPGAAVLPWAYAITRRLVIDAVRRRSHEDLRANPVDGATEEPSGAAAADEALHWKRSEAALTRDLLAIAPALRESFELLKVEGLSVAEAAEVLGITRGMVKIRAHRATVALRAAHMRRERSAVRVASDGNPSGEGEAPT
jgi:RNA polymerase sigma-70 factor, ECF subfamily